MAFYRRLFIILPAMVLFALSCTKPVLIGSDFLEDEKASIGYKEDFDLSFYTERSDSVIVHSDNVTLQLSNYLVGNIEDDPIFGNYKAEIFAQPVITTSTLALKGSTLDSVVLQLNYDTLGNYGSLSEPVKLEVYRMRENPDWNQEYYSDQRFATDPLPLGSLTFVPRPYDSVAVGTGKIAPSIRIPLSISDLSDFLVQEDTVYENQEKFVEFFNGLNIRMTSGSNTMLGFRLLNGSVSVLSFYYDGTSQDQQVRLVFTTGYVKTVYMEHDYTGSVVEPYLNPEEESDYWFVQGLAGVTTKMVVEDLASIGNAIINQADLEVYGTYLNDDNPDFYPAIEYLVAQESSDSILVNSIDVNQALSRAQGNNLNPVFDFYFGGKVEQILPGPQAIFKYSMKVTAQVKDIFLGKKENIIYFNPFEKANVPNRSVMFGPGHPDYAPKLRIYYTSL